MFGVSDKPTLNETRCTLQYQLDQQLAASKVYHSKERGGRRAVGVAVDFGGLAHLGDALDALRQHIDGISGGIMEQEPRDMLTQGRGAGSWAREPAALLEKGLIGAVDGGGVKAA